MRLLLLCLLIALTACATSPTGRKSLYLFPESQMAQMGLTAYSEMKSKTPISKDMAKTRYVQCVAQAVTAAIPPQQNPGYQWEVTLFEDDSANAFALPGGKIGVHTGIFKVATDADMLAAVIGHEIEHVLNRHSNERMSAEYATQTGLQLLQTMTTTPGAANQNHDQLFALLGLGAQVGILLPYGRGQESEADVLGINLMAMAGFNPQKSITLWQNMEKAGNGQPPEFLSTHPSHGRRTADLEAGMPQALSIYQQARAGGRVPKCR